MRGTRESRRTKNDGPRSRPPTAPTGDTPDSTRRRVLAVSGAALVGGLAGCGGGDGGSPADPEYERLDRTATYVADGVELSVPGEIPTVDAKNEADLLVLPASTGRAARRVVEWLVDGRAVALLGAAAEQTWLAWAGSDAYRDAFGQRAEATPSPTRRYSSPRPSAWT